MFGDSRWVYYHQAIVVPVGNHKVVLEFYPDSYYDNVTLSYASLCILYMVNILGL
jgi:uncharacterized membrane protein YfhO